MRIQRLLLHEVGPFTDLDLIIREGQNPSLADVHLLVGPNGSGKSTLLFALAQTQTSKETPLLARMRGKDAQLWAKSNGYGWMGLTHNSQRLNPTTPMGGRAHTGALIGDWHVHSEGLFPSAASGFAYSGARTADVSPLKAIQEVDPEQLQGPLGFSHLIDLTLVKQWIANQHAKAAFARNRGDEAAALARELPVRVLERTLSDVTGSDVAFQLQEEPLEVLLSQNGRRADFAVLPDGLKGILTWLGDLLMRLDRRRVEPGSQEPPTSQPFLLFLDEVEVHLHPAWQRRIVPTVQRLFPKAQIFIATHSPFVVASADDAWIYPLDLGPAGAIARDVLPSRLGYSYQEVLHEVFGIESDFDPDTEQLLHAFQRAFDRRLVGDVAPEFDALAATLSRRSPELANLVERERRALARRLRAG